MSDDYFSNDHDSEYWDDVYFEEHQHEYSTRHQSNVIYNVYGDTNQLLKPGRGIASWDELKQRFSMVEHVLNENYRNTNQITRFCNKSFDMEVLQTGVDGVQVKEISRTELEKELASLKISTERIAVLVPRAVQKSNYVKKDLLPSNISRIIDSSMDNGRISIMYVDEVKGIEFDKVYVISNKMSRNEKYIAYTRALSELIVVVDNDIPDVKVVVKPKKETISEKIEAQIQERIKAESIEIAPAEDESIQKTVDMSFLLKSDPSISLSALRQLESVGIECVADLASHKLIKLNCDILSNRIRNGIFDVLFKYADTLYDAFHIDTNDESSSADEDDVKYNDADFGEIESLEQSVRTYNRSKSNSGLSRMDKLSSIIRQNIDAGDEVSLRNALNLIKLLGMYEIEKEDKNNN